ncbi:MAG: hypothetical protein KBT28_12520 [Bacteroidales bacterium]|nr:hypothetical protein [Candidatus Colimorpha merdihippi]
MNDEFKQFAAARYAEHVRGVKLRCDALDFDVQSMRESLTGVKGVTYSGTPLGHGAYGDAIPDGVAKLEQMIVESTTALVEWLDVKREACECFSRLDSKSYALLTYYYANALTWSDTANLLGYKSKEHVQRELKPLALIALYDVMPEEWRRNFPNAEI